MKRRNNTSNVTGKQSRKEAKLSDEEVAGTSTPVPCLSTEGPNSPVTRAKQRAFRALLKELTDHISSNELAILKALVKDKEGYGKALLKDNTTAWKLFERMEENCDLSPAKTDWLKDLLAGIHRRDLCAKVDTFQQSYTNVPTVPHSMDAGTTVGTNTDRDSYKTPPPPATYHLKVFLTHVSVNLKPGDLEKMKDFVSEPYGIGAGVLQKCTDGMDFFNELAKRRFVSPNNCVVVQALLLHIGRNDLCEWIANYLKDFDQILHVSHPLPVAGPGYGYVKFHLKGPTMLSKALAEEMRKNIASWLCVPPHCVIIAGVEQTKSWMITIMVQEHSIKIIPDVVKTHAKWFIELGIDWFKIGKKTFPVTEPVTRRKKSKSYPLDSTDVEAAHSWVEKRPKQIAKLMTC